MQNVSYSWGMGLNNIAVLMAQNRSIKSYLSMPWWRSSSKYWVKSMLAWVFLSSPFVKSNILWKERELFLWQSFLSQAMCEEEPSNTSIIICTGILPILFSQGLRLCRGRCYIYIHTSLTESFCHKEFTRQINDKSWDEAERGRWAKQVGWEWGGGDSNVSLVLCGLIEHTV